MATKQTYTTLNKNKTNKNRAQFVSHFQLLFIIARFQRPRALGVDRNSSPHTQTLEISSEHLLKKKKTKQKERRKEREREKKINKNKTKKKEAQKRE